MKFLALLLFAIPAAANPCDSWFCTYNKNVIRVRGPKLSGLDNTVLSLEPTKPGLVERLQKKLGPKYKVVLLTPDEFNAHGHDCN